MKIPLKDVEFLRREDDLFVNPREDMSADDLEWSIAYLKQQQPIQVFERETPQGKKYFVIDGHRRVVTMRKLGYEFIEAEITDGQNILARMLASDVHKPLKPTEKARGLERLMLESQMPLETAAQVIGMKPDKAGLILDLLKAPESVQRRVDNGELSLSAWKVLRDKPKDLQKRAAELEKPTLENVKKEVKQNKNAGILADMLDALSVDHTILTKFNDVRYEVMGAWNELTEDERMRLTASIESLLQFVSAQEKAIA